MILTTNILPLALLPLALLLWALDVYVFMLSARLVLQHIRAAWAGRANLHLAAFTDPVLGPAQRLLRRLWPAGPTWGTSCSVLLTLLLCRYALVRLLLAFFNPTGRP